MTIIKEHAGRRCIIREDNYDHRASKFMRLINEATDDFPMLAPHEIEVVHFGGRDYRGTWGIEFDAPDGAVIPDEYVAVAQVEFTL